MARAPKNRCARGPVPASVRHTLAVLDARLGRARTLEEIGISQSVFEEAVAPCGILRFPVLAKIQAAIKNLP